MRQKTGRIYRSFNPLKIGLKILAWTVAVVLTLTILVFFGFQKYRVYTDDGVHLEIPWLMEEAKPSASPAE